MPVRQSPTEHEPSVKTTSDSPVSADGLRASDDPGQATGMDVLRAITRSTRWLLMGAVLGKIIQLAGSAVVARFITPDVLGLFVLGTLTIAIAQILCDCGIGFAMVQHPDERVLPSGLLVLLGASAACFVGCLVFARPLAQAIGDSRLSDLLPVLSVRLLITPFLTVANVKLTRKLRYGEATAAGLASGVLGSIVSIVVAWRGFAIWALVAGDFTTLLVQCVSQWILTGESPKLGLDRKHVRQLGGFGTIVLAETLLGWLIINADSFLLGRMQGAGSVGTYKLGGNIGLAMLLTITAPVLGLMFAGLSRLASSRAQFESAFFDGMRIVTHLSFAWAGFLIPCAGLVIRVVYGPSWTDAAPIASIFGALAAAASPGMIPPQAYRALGRPRINVYFLAVQFACAAPVFLFVSRWGARPLAWAQLIQVSFFTVVNLSIAARVLRIPFVKLLHPLRGPVLVGAILLGANRLLAAALSPFPPLLALAVHLATSGVVGLAALRQLDREAWQLAKRVVQEGLHKRRSPSVAKSPLQSAPGKSAE